MRVREGRRDQQLAREVAGMVARASDPADVAAILTDFSKRWNVSTATVTMVGIALLSRQPLLDSAPEGSVQIWLDVVQNLLKVGIPAIARMESEGHS